MQTAATQGVDPSELKPVTKDQGVDPSELRPVEDPNRAGNELTDLVPAPIKNILGKIGDALDYVTGEKMAEKIAGPQTVASANRAAVDPNTWAMMYGTGADIREPSLTDFKPESAPEAVSPRKATGKITGVGPVGQELGRIPPPRPAAMGSELGTIPSRLNVPRPLEPGLEGMSRGEMGRAIDAGNMAAGNKLTNNVPLKDQGGMGRIGRLTSAKGELTSGQDLKMPVKAPDIPAGNTSPPIGKIGEHAPSSHPERAVLERAGATRVEAALIEMATRKLSNAQYGEWAAQNGFDMGDRSVGRGAEDAKAGTHISRQEILDGLIKQGKKPNELGASVDAYIKRLKT